MTRDDEIIVRLTRDLHTAGSALQKYNKLVWDIREAIHCKNLVTNFNEAMPKSVEAQLMYIDKKDYDAFQKVKDLIKDFRHG